MFKRFRNAPEHRPLLDRSNSAYADNAVDLEGSYSGPQTEFEPACSKRREIILWLDSSIYAHRWDCFGAHINLLLVVNYIIMAEYQVSARFKVPGEAPHFLKMLDLILALVLLLQYIPRVYLSVDYTAKSISPLSICTYLSVFAVTWATLNSNTSGISFLSVGNIIFLYPFRFWRLHYSLLAVIGPGKLRFLKITLVTQKVLRLFLSIFSTLVVVTSWVHITLFVIQRYYDLSFFDVFYSISVSATSGLATQIVPDNMFSRFVTLYIMIVGAIFIPTNIATLLMLINSESKYLKPFTQNTAHIVLAGSFDYSLVRGFLREFYNDDHVYSCATLIVMLGPSDPDEQLIQLLADPVYCDRVTYINGSAISFDSFKKAKLNSAKLVYLFSGSLKSVEEDAKTVMRALAMKKYCKTVRIYAQIHQPETRVHFMQLAEQVLCIDEFRLGLMAQNCLFPGVSTLLYLLTTSVSPSILRNFGGHLNSDTKSYLNGALNEIYEVDLSAKLYNHMTFQETCCYIKSTYSSTMIALVVNNKVLINPLGYRIQGSERALIISTDSNIARNAGLRFGYSMSDAQVLYTDVALRIQARCDDYLKLGVFATNVANFSSNSLSLTDLVIPDPIPAELCGIDNSSLHDGLNYSHHILICSHSASFPTNLSFFIDPIRNVDSSMIVILTLSEPSQYDSAELKSFKNVVIIKGSPLKIRDLQRCSLTQASRCIILANALHEGVSSRSADAPSLLCLLNCQRLEGPSSSIHIVLELIHPENTKLISSSSRTFKAFSGSDVGQLGYHITNTAFMSGHLFTLDMFYSLFAQAFHTPHLISFLRSLIFPAEVTASRSFSVCAPDDRFVGTSTNDMYVYLLVKHGLHLIGVYRSSNDTSDTKYVLVHPDGAVQSGDDFFVIGASGFSWN